MQMVEIQLRAITYNYLTMVLVDMLEDPLILVPTEIKVLLIVKLLQMPHMLDTRPIAMEGEEVNIILLQLHVQQISTTKVALVDQIKPKEAKLLYKIYLPL